MTIDSLASDARVTVRVRGRPDPDGDAVVYWMQRAQRAVDNPALDVAIAAGNALSKPVVVFFGLNPFVERANLRHYTFLAEGLVDVARGLAERRVGFVFRRYPQHRLLPFLADVAPALIIGDENPLRQPAAWRDQISEAARRPFWTVDADVVVPSALIETEQYAARTIRPRIHRHIEDFLVPSADAVARVPWHRSGTPVGSAADVVHGLPIDDTTRPVDTLRGGTAAARDRLTAFIASDLPQYATGRNRPERDGSSRLSPYLHFGHIGPREVARAVRASGADAASIAAFLEQLVVRRELAINFVRFNPGYESLDGLASWARRTLARHECDRRSHVYAPAELESGSTHDPLWNASQRQMVTTGWMHGYVRMYWAKKILEWSETAAEALRTAILLNDRYLLDGRDPSGYSNIAWAIGGKHDRPWPSRPVYGTIRSMSFASTTRKFDAAAYIERFGTAADATRYATARQAKVRRRSKSAVSR